MKKLFALVMTIAMLLCCCAAAEEESTVPVPEAAAVFEGQWVCDRANIEMIWEEEGFRVHITWGESVSEGTEWEYSCTYNAETNALESVIANGIKTDCVYGDDGSVASFETVYEDGEATFTLDEEKHLIWHDAKEDAGKNLQFEFAGPVEAVTENP